MSWYGIRTGIERVTHGVFNEPATYTPPGGGDPVAIVGVLSQRVEPGAMAEIDEIVIAEHVNTYEIRKEADEGPWTIDSFEIQGAVQLVNGGQVFTITQSTQTDTLVTLYLAAN